MKKALKVQDKLREKSGRWNGISEVRKWRKRNMLDGHCTLIAPDLLIYELANALKYNPNFSSKDVKASMDSVYNMGIDIRGVDSLVQQ